MQLDPARLFTVAINFTAVGAGDTTVRAAVAGRRWAIYYLHLESSASIDLIVKSGTTAITGAIAITATLVLDFEAGGELPVLIADGTNKAFAINVSAAGDVDGWAIMGEFDR